MSDRIKKVGEEKGMRPRESFEDLENRSIENMKLFAEIARESVDAMTISESEKEIARLKAENARLKAELDRAIEK